MAKAKKSAARKSGSTAGKKSAAKSTASKTAAAKSSASAAASKAGTTAAEVKAEAVKTSQAVSPSEMKKQLEADAKPLPKVAKEPESTGEIKEDVKQDVKAEVSKEAETKKSEPVVEKAAVAPPPPPPPAEAPKQRSTFVPLVLGGVVAAGLGYFASATDFLGFGGNGGSDDGLRASIESQEGRLSALESAPAPEVDLSAVDTLSEQVAGSTSRLEELGAQLTEMSGSLEALQADSATMSETLDGLDTRLGDFDTRLTDIEKRPITDTAGSDEAVAAAVAAYQRELAALQASVEEQRTELQTAAETQRAELQASVDAQRVEIEALLENAVSVEEAAAETARVANVQKALTMLTSALGSGEPFEASLAALAENGVTDVPAALSDVAADGVQTLSALQSEFPDNARASLNVARASGAGAEEETGVGGFLRRQLGARSVTPREGNGPDAVLSRAEAAVSEGRLSDALGELEALPAPAQEAMQDWLDAARARDAAQVATEELSQSLTAN